MKKFFVLAIVVVVSFVLAVSASRFRPARA